MHKIEARMKNSAKNYQAFDVDTDEASAESVLIHVVPENKCTWVADILAKISLYKSSLWYWSKWDVSLDSYRYMWQVYLVLILLVYIYFYSQVESHRGFRCIFCSCLSLPPTSWVHMYGSSRVFGIAAISICGLVFYFSPEVCQLQCTFQVYIKFVS